MIKSQVLALGWQKSTSPKSQSYAYPTRFTALIWGMLAQEILFVMRLTFGCKAAPRFSDVLSEAAYWICQTIMPSNPHSINPFRQLKLFRALNSLSDAARAHPVEQIRFSVDYW